MKKKMKKVMLAMAMVALTVVVSACGGDDEQPELYGNLGNNCNQMMNGYGYQPYPNPADLPANAYTLNGQPNGLIFRNNLNGQCYTGNQFGNMWSQYGLPPQNFYGSPYANNFDVYNPYGYGPESKGSTSYTSNTNYHSDWTNAGSYFGGGGYPGSGGYYPNGWGFDFWYQGK